jgi:hypothetical protein
MKEIALLHKTDLAVPRYALLEETTMCTSSIVCIRERFGVYSFTTGVAFKREPDLREEWKVNPNAVLERLAREARWEELETLMKQVPCRR